MGLDGWAKAAAGRGSRGASGRPELTRLSRRDLIKQAGVVAGVAWSVPLIESAVAPAYAASNQPIAYPCTSDAECLSGNCDRGFCATTGKKWTGGTCTTNSQCMSNRCRSGRCSTGRVGAPCTATADCRSPIQCASNKVCGGPGAACVFDSHCVSGRCRGFVCS